MDYEADELDLLEDIACKLFDLMDADPEFIAALRRIWDGEFEGRKEALRTLH